MGKKNTPAVALGSKFGARSAVQARSANADNGRSPKKKRTIKELGVAIATSDRALAALLERLKGTVASDEIRSLSDQIERVIFHKQFANT